MAVGLSGNMPTVHEYLSNFEPSGKAQNVSNSKRAIERFLAFAKEHHHTKLDALPVSACREWLRAELERVSIGTVTNYKKTLSSVFTRAIRDEILNRNPFALLRMNEVSSGVAVNPSTKRLPFSPDEMRLLLTNLPYPWREMVLISFLTGGQRIGDVARLRWESVDFERRMISFRTLKTGHVVDSPIVPELYACLSKLKEARLSYSPFVLPSMAERYERAAGALSTEFTGLLRGLGIIPPLAARVAGVRGGKKSVAPKSFHSIRHTVVSMLRSSNSVSPDLARAIVGHDSEEIERQYFTASHDDKLGGLQLLQDAISGS